MLTDALEVSTQYPLRVGLCENSFDTLPVQVVLEPERLVFHLLHPVQAAADFLDLSGSDTLVPVDEPFRDNQGYPNVFAYIARPLQSFLQELQGYHDKVSFQEEILIIITASILLPPGQISPRSNMSR